MGGGEWGRTKMAINPKPIKLLFSVSGKKIFPKNGGFEVTHSNHFPNL